MEEGDPRLILKEWWADLKGEQRFSVIVLGVCSVAALGFSVNQFFTQLRSPFMVPVAALKESQNYQQAQALAAQAREAARSKDTDHDGLTDDEELNVYHTSPYLADTDSDEVSDFAEVQKGTDPNCPSDRTCTLQIDVTQAQATSTIVNGLVQSTPSLSADLLGKMASSTSGNASDLSNPPPPGQMSPTELRKYLLDHNLVTVADLNALTDDMIMSVYRSAYANAMKVDGTVSP